MYIVRVWDRGIPIHEERFKNPMDAHPYAAFAATRIIGQGYEPAPNETPGTITLYSSETGHKAEIQVQELA